MRKFPSPGTPPQAAKKARYFVTHGDKRLDEYAWLQDPKDPKVQAYIADENAFADRSMTPTKSLQKKLYKEIRSRMTEDDKSVPIKRGAYYYYVRTKKGKQYAIHCRTLGEKGKEEIILDENELARGKSFFALGSIEVSPDNRLLAFSIDTKGDERFTLYIKDLKTRRILPERIRSADGLVWSADSAYLFYALEEHPFPPRKVYRHRVCTDAEKDQLVYAEKDRQWYVSIGDTSDKQYMIIHAGNFDTTECWFIPTDAPLDTPKLFSKRKKKVKYGVEHKDGYFYFTTNEKAVNFKIMRAPDATPQRSAWRTWMPHTLKKAVTGFVPFSKCIALTVRENGYEELYVRRDGGQWSRVVLPEVAHALSVTPELEYDSPFVQFTYQSLVTPRTIYNYVVDSGTLAERKRQKVPGWDSSLYAVERIWVKNGTARIPVSLVYPKGDLKRGPIPFFVDSYGSYGYTNDPYFSISRLSLLKRGWGIAIAHPRGGGEMGWHWHKAAHRLTKHRTYHDLIKVMDSLVARKYTTRDRLFLTGGSAGGMTAGTVMNMRPDLCRGALVYVPDADVITSSLDTSLGGTLLHYDELGDPRKKKEYLYLKRWSPYENIKRVEYPALLVRASMHDIRTPYWEAAKWVARLRSMVTTRGRLLLKIENNAGHGGKSGRYEWIKERAHDYAFLLTSV